MKLALISVLVAIGISSAKAHDITNVVIQVNISLTGFKQSGDSNATPVRVGTKDILNILGALNGREFARGARLLILTDAPGEELPKFLVRERIGTENVDTDVTPNFPIFESGQKASRNTIEYSILTIGFTDGLGNDFTVNGFATVRQGRAPGTGGVGAVFDVTVGATASVAGMGHIGGDFAVVKGTITAGSAKAEPDND